ncbi:putative integral membrane protein (putative) [Lactiplantibacillus plantarum]|nr:putative integral membrane protein (putative) [Lactiplantibacillus plantarum]
MVYFGLVALLIVITPLHRYVLASRRQFWLGSLMPLLWLGVNFGLATQIIFEHQDILLAALGTLLLLSSWIAARIDRTERQLHQPQQKATTK